MLKTNKNILIYGLILCAVLIAAYANHFNNGFHFDDSHTIVDNVHIRDIKNIPSFFSDPKMFSADPAHWGLRPLVTTTLAIDYWLAGGLNPFYFQLSTFIWYVLLCLLLYFMYKNLLAQSIKHTWVNYIILVTTAWYTLHTVNAETINYIIARSDVLSTLCIVASFLIYIAFPAKRKWYLYIIPAFIGVFAKETVLVLIILLFFYTLLFENKLSLSDLFKAGNFKTVLNTIVKLLPVLIIVAVTQAYALTRLTNNNYATNVSNPLGYFVLTQAYVWVHYFISFFLPLNLSADSDMTTITNVFDERIIIGLTFIIFLVIAIFKTSAKAETKPIAFGLIWFAAALLPTSLIPLSEVTNDHRMFFAFIGLALSVCTFIGLWLIRVEKQVTANKFYIPLISTCILLVLGLNAYGVYQRNKVWKDEESLWLDVTIKSPLNGRGLMNYGLTQMAKGNYAVADTYFEKAAPMLPYYSTLYINIGVLKGATNNPAEAEANFKKAIALSPGSYQPYVFYARWLRDVGRLADARPVAQTAIQLNPYTLMGLDILMSADNNLGLYDELKKTASQVLAIAPNDVAAQTYLEAGKLRKPATGIGITPTTSTQALTADDYLNLSLGYYNSKNYDKCIEACKQALQLKPNYAAAYSNMGAAYNMMQQWQKGFDACTRALQIDPNNKLAMGNLNWAKNGLAKK